MAYLGNYKEDATVYFLWHSTDGSGASITRATDGTISVYKDNGVAQSTSGITDTEDFDSLTGVHACTIDLSSHTFYAIGADYSVVLSAATIDGQTVNAVLAHFSIENRFDDINLSQAIATFTGSPDTVGEAFWFMRQIQKNKLKYDKATNQMILYEDDGTTPKLTFSMTDDSSEATRGAGS